MLKNLALQRLEYKNHRRAELDKCHGSECPDQMLVAVEEADLQQAERDDQHQAYVRCQSAREGDEQLPLIVVSQLPDGAVPLR